MIQRDYILRMIEEIGRFLAKLSGMKNDGLNGKGFDEFLNFLSVHFRIKPEDINMDNFPVIQEKLKSAFENYPDDLGQLFLSGGELAENADRRSQSEVLYLLAWEAFQTAENETQTFRFERVVEMNAVKDKLALMGINVGEE